MALATIMVLCRVHRKFPRVGKYTVNSDNCDVIFLLFFFVFFFTTANS